MGKSALITGCSEGGIGDAMAQEFHRRGIRVFATARSLEKVEHLKKMGIDVLELDVISSDSIANAVKALTEATGGRLDFLVNNSGRGHTSPLLDTDLKIARETFDLNVISVLAVTQQFAPALIAAKGKIINIGSVGGRLVTPYTGIYASSKAALNLLSETMRVEFSPLGVQVITVIAGTVNTKFYANQPQFQLPRDSLYIPIETKINKTISGELLGRGATEPSEFAKDVVANALQIRSTLWFWCGAKSSIVWFINTFLPHTFLVSLLS
ncbi:hypothetical protein F5884DRAFT_881205 [Xylogone sp. PMI_703]|nr:hypothetical protein F5884DRAFT_881205 [Xylogone sp. PMI_703]